MLSVLLLSSEKEHTDPLNRHGGQEPAMRVALKVRVALGAEEQVWAKEPGPLHVHTPTCCQYIHSALCK